MIAKGHDVHGVTLVGVVGADYALSFPDFRAAERTFQLLTQVAGRAGRGETPGRVVLQTYHPDHYAIQFAQQHDYSGFYDKEVRYRKWMHYPPFSALANVLVRSDKLEQTLKWTGQLGRWFETTRNEGVRGARALGGAHHAAQAGLPVSLYCESDRAEKVKRCPAPDAGLRWRAKDPAHKRSCGRRRVIATLRDAAAFAAAGTLALLPGGCGPQAARE